MVVLLDSLRQRLPAPRQDQEARRLRKERRRDTEDDGRPQQHVYEAEGVNRLAQDAPPWYLSPARRNLYLLLFPGAVCSYATSGYDGSLLGTLQTVGQWDEFFNQPRGAILGIMSAAMSLGSIFSTPIAPWVADRYGRRWGITVGSIIMIAGAIMQCESVNLAMFIVSRFILGFGLSFATTAAPSLVTELSHPKDRVTITAICNTCWGLGSICAAWITFGTRNINSDWSWRLPSLFQMIPSVAQLAAIWFLPESPRWLVSNDRDSEALEALIKYHGEGEETELVKLEYEEIRTAIHMEKVNGATTWKSMMGTPGNRYRMFLVLCMGFMSQWSGNGLISYYLARIMDSVGITNKNTQALVNGILNIYTFLLALTTAFFVERIGRRPLFRVSTVGMLTIFVAWTVASARFQETGASSAGVAVMVLIFVYCAFYNIAFAPLAVAYSVEILPYSIRAKGMATYVFSTKAAVFVNQFVNPIGLANIGWKYYIVYVAILAVECFIAYGWFIETKGKALEEISVLFDGKDASVQVDDRKQLDMIEVEDSGVSVKKE
ncbi:general substrate transporter [Plectosphaerella plurivora]|uniref:General substrate transporter n=1 Tax=Plectosphaerella plurivora TaxID=936078 RepID=A0A9P8V0L7_9PEZI|nr:general substrate transporter [Plectosphaerella plurivora]